MKWIKLFEDDFEKEEDKFRIEPPKIVGPKVVGKIDLEDVKKSGSIEIDLDVIPEDFKDEIIRKVDGYFKKYPKINDDFHIDDRLESLLDLNKIGKPWDLLNNRLMTTKAQTFFDKKKFFRFDKKLNCYTMLSTHYKRDSLKNITDLVTNLFCIYGPIKGEKKLATEQGHGDFYFSILEGNYYVYTKHAFERYWERGLKLGKKHLNPDELKKSIQSYMSESSDIRMKTENPPEIKSKEGVSLLKLDSGAFIGSISKSEQTTNLIIIFNTFYSPDMYKKKHIDIINQKD